MYSQFQISESYFPGRPAGRPFQNVYLKQETEERQMLIQPKGVSKNKTKSNKQKNPRQFREKKSGLNEGFGRG